MRHAVRIAVTLLALAAPAGAAGAMTSGAMPANEPINAPTTFHYAPFGRPDRAAVAARRQRNAARRSGRSAKEPTAPS